MTTLAEHAHHVDAPDVDAPDVDAPDVDAPDVDAPDVVAHFTDAPGVDGQLVEAPGVDVRHVDGSWVDAVVGGDTHADSHTLVMLAPTGVVLAEGVFPATAQGSAQVLAWIAENAPGPQVVVGLEGTRSYGIALTRALQTAGLLIAEVERPSRTTRRGRGKSDPIDAAHAARAVLVMLAERPGQLPAPRADGDREALRILLGARRRIATTRTADLNDLYALLRTGSEQDRAWLARGPLTSTTLRALTRRRGRSHATREERTRLSEATRLARAVLNADRQLKTNHAALTAIVTDLAPALLDQPGVGPVSAAQAVVSYSHHGRIRHEAAFAALAGTAPLPASSGRTTRHRLNRGGDRALNAALHTIVITRARCDDRTRAYIARRRAEGLTDREIRRCLKRYATRALYRTMRAAPALSTP